MHNILRGTPKNNIKPVSIAGDSFYMRPQYESLYNVTSSETTDVIKWKRGGVPGHPAENAAAINSVYV